MRAPLLHQSRTLVTGASSGIGWATARLFAEHGSDVVLLARRGDRLDALAKEIRASTGVTVDVLRADVADVAETHAALAAYCEGRPIDIAVINAGIGSYGPFHDTSWTEANTILRTNIDGALTAAHAVLTGMLRREHGSIVFISSVLGKRALPWNSVYCASKFALQGFADALRLELRHANIHVGIVCPGRTDTEFFTRIPDPSAHAKRRFVPVATPERVARAVLRCVRTRKREITVGVMNALYTTIGYHFPRLSDFLISIAMQPHDGF
ncbi:MAG: SDR family oxidoreductase [Bacteroidota bacterium]|nr:SDR family oxidoreductase [Bacteroidota bacterium]